MSKLQDKIVIVTGGARGIGEAVTRRFAAEGALVVIVDTLQAEGALLANDIGGTAQFVHMNITVDSDWKKLVADLLKRYGRIDALVANAGVLSFGLLIDADENEFDRVFAVNVKGVFLGIKHVGRAMANAGAGSIVNIASLDAFRGVNALGIYSSSKWAVRGITKSAALELGPLGVRVNSVHPGGINTFMNNPDGTRTMAELNHGHRRVPLQRIGEPEEVAAACLFLSSDEASYISGAELAVDGGWTAGYYHETLPGAPSTLL